MFINLRIFSLVITVHVLDLFQLFAIRIGPWRTNP